MQEFENVSLEVTDLRRKLTFTTENESLHLEYKAAMSKNQELKKMISDLEIEAEQRQNIIQAVKDESAQLKAKLVAREKYLSSSAELHKVRENEVSAWTKELEGQIASLKLEQNALSTKKREMEQQIESKTIEIRRLGEENSKLQAQIVKLEKISEGKGKGLSAVTKKLLDHEKNSCSKINDLVAQVHSLQVEVGSLSTQIGKLEEELESNRNEASAQVKRLMEQADKERLLKADQIDELQHKFFELETTLKERGEESYALQRKFENGANEVSARFMSLTTQFNQMKKEFDILQTEKSQLELQIARERQESLESLIQVKTENSELKASKEEVEEKLSLMQAVSQLEEKVVELEKLVKEKEEGMQELGEEKREVIRQLCMLVDYHRSRYDHLNEMISKFEC